MIRLAKAQWPAWSKKQARAAGLVCAECDYDLREFKDESRRPFDVRLPERPKRQRLVCGQCCNDGVDEMEHSSSGRTAGRYRTFRPSGIKDNPYAPVVS